MKRETIVVVCTVDGVEVEPFIDGEQADGESEQLAVEIKAGSTDPFIEVHVVRFDGTRRTAKQILEALNKRSSRSFRTSSAPEIMEELGLTPDGKPNVPEGGILLRGGGVLLPEEKTPLLEIDLGIVPAGVGDEETTASLEIDPFDDTEGGVR